MSPRGLCLLALGALLISGCASGGNTASREVSHRHGTRARIVVFLPPWSPSALQPLVRGDGGEEFLDGGDADRREHLPFVICGDL